MKVFMLFMALFANLTLGIADDYAIDSVHSNVVFKIKHLNVSNFYGLFKEVSGKFSFDNETLSMTTEVNTNSIDTRNEKRDNHLRSSDFFNVKKYPMITFKSTKVEKSGKQFNVTGDLTLLGTTKEVQTIVTFIGMGKGMKGETRAGFEATFTIKRSDFGLNYMLDTLGDEVALIVSVEGVKNP